MSIWLSPRFTFREVSYIRYVTRLTYPRIENNKNRGESKKNMNSYSDIVENFLNNFQKLTTNFKKIFRYLQGIAKTYRNVYPSVPTIAKNTGCSESTVKRATALFRVLGFLRSEKVAYQSNYYYIIPDLIRLNTRDHNSFKNATQSTLDPSVDPCVDPCVDPVFTNTKEIKEKDTSTGSVSLGNYKQKNNQQNRPIQQFLKISGLSPQEQQDLSNKFSEYALVNALKDAIWYDGQKNKILSLVKFLWNRAKAHSLNLV